MDANKLRKIQAINYRILPTCELCINSRFPNTLASFGTCKLELYEHRKHTEAMRDLSIFRGGTCDKHDWNEHALGRLGTWAQFRQQK